MPTGIKAFDIAHVESQLIDVDLSYEIEKPSRPKFCRNCGHRLAEQNNTGKCYRHSLEDSPTQPRAIIIIPPPSPISPDRIIEAVCRFFDLTLNDLQAVDKMEKRRIARKALMFLLVRDGNMGVKDAGKILERDYHAVRFAMQEIAAELQRGSDIAQDILKIRAQYLAA